MTQLPPADLLLHVSVEASRHLVPKTTSEANIAHHFPCELFKFYSIVPQAVQRSSEKTAHICLSTARLFSKKLYPDSTSHAAVMVCSHVMSMKISTCDPSCWLRGDTGEKKNKECQPFVRREKVHALPAYVMSRFCNSQGPHLASLRVAFGHVHQLHKDRLLASSDEALFHRVAIVRTKIFGDKLHLFFSSFGSS